MYDERSKYGLTRVIRESSDPVAQTIALNEMIDLLEMQRRCDCPSSSPNDAGSNDSRFNTTLKAREYRTDFTPD